MKIQKYKFENEEIIQIYISKKEQANESIIEKINKLKNEYSNISIFISGENDTVKTIKEILNHEKNRKFKEIT